MSELRDFVADLLERQGAAIEAGGAGRARGARAGALQQRHGLARAGAARLRDGACPPARLPIGLEGDWLDRFGALLADAGRWSERELVPPARSPPPSDPERVLERALDLPNAVWRFQGMTATWTRCLMLAFRYTAVSDEKREGLIWLGFNLGTGAVHQRHPGAAAAGAGANTRLAAPDPATHGTRPGRHGTRRRSQRGCVRCSISRCATSIEPFLRAMRRRLERDRNRVHAYHDDLRSACAQAPGGARRRGRRAGRRPIGERETLRVEAIEREYRAKLDDLRHNYALRVTVEWVQALDSIVPVQRFEVLIRRRKGERVIQLDWHPLVKAAEPPLCEAGLGLDRSASSATTSCT